MSRQLGATKLTHVEAAHILGRLEYLRGELRAERISQGELLELQSLSQHIAPGDVELLEAAGVPEQVNTETKFTPVPFTPGPWTTSVVSKEQVIGPSGSQICECFTPFTKERAVTSYAQVFANAALIAAAPEMFEALQSALSHIEQHDQTHSTRTAYDRVMNAGRAALAKAKGGAK